MQLACTMYILSFSQKGCQTAVLIESLLVTVAGLLNQSSHPKLDETRGCGADPGVWRLVPLRKFNP